MNEEDFPILKQRINGKRLVYLDSAATAQKPSAVIEGMKKYYESMNSNTHRSAYTLANRATEAFENSRSTIAKFINASKEEIVFTSGTTGSLNMLANSLGKSLKKGDEIVITEMEHHSNLVPWQQLAKEKGLVLKYICVDKNGELDLRDADKKITAKTKIVSATQMSNVLGTINDVRLLGRMAHSKKAIFVVDAAQSITHMPLDVKSIDCDFLAFSGHKLLGPTGVGILYGKKKLLENLEPTTFGGGMISEVNLNDSKWNDLPWKFEAGTPNIAGAIGLGIAVEYLNSIGMKKIETHINAITKYALKSLSNLEGVKVYGHLDSSKRGGLVSFNVDGVHPHDVSAILDREGIAVRGGHMCAMPLVTEVLKTNSVCRASFHLYNSKEDVDKLIQGIVKVQGVFKK